MMTDYIKRAEALAPEERTLDFPEKYTEIRALYHFASILESNAR